MFKKLIGLIMVLAIIAVCQIQVFAANDSAAASIAESNYKLINRILQDSEAEDNENGIVEIKKPEEAIITTCKESYTISGETSFLDVKIYLAKFNEEKNEYIPFENSDGESSWSIGEYGKFAKGINLSKGANKLKLVAVKEKDSKELKADDIQVSMFTITYLEKSLADRLVKGVQDGIEDFKTALKNFTNSIK